MKRVYLCLTVLAAMSLGAGCMKAPKRGGHSFAAPVGAMMTAPQAKGGSGGGESFQRMLVQTASLNLEVWDVGQVVTQAEEMVVTAGGYVQSKNNSEDASASLVLRIPADKLSGTVDGLAGLGTVTYRNTGNRDVTEEYIDVEARLKNMVALRDRLRQLLDRAVDVKDIVAIEAELNRVQSEIDSFEARRKTLKDEVDFATVYLNLDRKTVLGPLGYVVKGMWWVVEKLFVLRN